MTQSCIWQKQCAVAAANSNNSGQKKTVSTHLPGQYFPTFSIITQDIYDVSENAENKHNKVGSNLVC